MVTNDDWDNHVPGAALGTITDELSAHVVLYVWNGRMYGTAHATGVQLVPPDGVLLSGL